MSASAVVFWESAAYCSQVGDPAVVQSAIAVLFLSLTSQQEVLQGQGHFLVGEILMYSHTGFLIKAFSKSFVPQLDM